MRRAPMDQYEQAYRDFAWEIPARFNFAADVVDRYAEDPARLALIWCDASGREERYTFAALARSHAAAPMRCATPASGKATACW